HQDQQSGEGLFPPGEVPQQASLLCKSLDLGASLLEYVLLIALIVLLALGSLRFFSTTASTRFSEIASDIGNVL
ncbi:MAG: hypothetical protein KDD64_05450, partial [Bdellovibrionales bacterium]|nr:hypothetical protein [Bdellovibrionales bacterium]